MAKTIEARTYEEALAWLRDHGFDVTDAPGTNARVFLRKYNVSAAIQKGPDDTREDFRLSRLPDRQRDFEADQPRIPAVSQDLQNRNSGHGRPLKALQSFSEELKEGLGLPSLYNESLGTVSESYQYDRIENRDKPPVDRPKRPWEVAGKAAAVAAKKGRA